jgi:Skp family chaperone for outer membrane proteins
MKKLSDDINEALVTVAKDKKASTIFVNSAIVVKTEHVEDVTPEIIKQLKSK